MTWSVNSSSMTAARDVLTAKLSSIEWHRVVLLVLFTSGLISAVLALDILTGKGNDTSGIFTWAIADTSKRSLPSVPELPLTTALSQAETALPKGIPTSIISRVESGMGSIATTVSGLMPQSLTLGTKQFCLIFPHRSDCQTLPVSLPAPLSSTLDSTTLQALDRASTLCDPKTLEALLVMGSVLCFAVMGVSLVLCFNPLQKTVVQRGRYLLLFLTLAVFILFVVPAVFWSKVTSVVSKAVVGLIEGDVPKKSVAMAVCAASSIIFSLLYLLLLYKSGLI